jgi:hypothetical protein
MSSGSPFGPNDDATPWHTLTHALTPRALRVVLVGFALGGCDGAAATDTGTPIDLSGTWHLVSVGGTPLPYDISATAGRTTGDKYQEYYGSLEFTANAGNYGFRDSTRYTSPGGFATLNVVGDDGVATRSGNVLTLTSGRTSTTVKATVVGTAIHATRDAVDYVYTR